VGCRRNFFRAHGRAICNKPAAMNMIADRPRRGRPRSSEPAEAAEVKSLDRALALLAIIADANGLSLSEAAARAALPPSTAHRLLGTLARHGMVELDAAAQTWSVGVEAFRVGSKFLSRRKLPELARATMQDLVDALGETANLAVADEDGVVFISQVETHAPIRAFFRPGTRGPFHASGIGKVILAHLPAGRVAAAVRRAGLSRYTARTIISETQLTDELARIRQAGYAVDDEERNDGMRCIAAPIFNEFAEPIAGVSISGPTVRVTADSVASIGPRVAEAAAAITRAVGGRGPG
jgi:IclR family acetate operon transcriptional repressor